MKYDIINYANDEVKQAKKNLLLLIALQRRIDGKKGRFLVDGRWYRACINDETHMLEVYWAKSMDVFEVVSLRTMANLQQDIRNRHEVV